MEGQSVGSDEPEVVLPSSSFIFMLFSFNFNLSILFSLSSLPCGRVFWGLLTFVGASDYSSECPV